MKLPLLLSEVRVSMKVGAGEEGGVMVCVVVLGEGVTAWNPCLITGLGGGGGLVTLEKTTQASSKVSSQSCRLRALVCYWSALLSPHQSS